ncbi:fasciclin domain-containing protein [Streptomyces sp. NBC_00259]|uniref:fasciclin domain-containing protein n=1 Tax=Streptomyces sp. NBC_00259 TaxID=2903643 RepID=UPI002E29018C|nr:fasciclin domain-containing protein [Streptomyces sp. NBC_00259]
MNTSLTRRRVVAAFAVVALPLSLGVMAPQASATDRDGPFGPGCASVPKNGAGSLDDMADDPVATAASNNPALSTLASTVKQAGLVDTLNSAENITVFAPTNDAFAKIPKADLDKLPADRAMLTKILTYHVAGQAIDKADLADGSFKTLEGGTLTTSGSGDAYKINGTASIVCGDVPTSNATVHIIDTVLMPK